MSAHTPGPWVTGNTQPLLFGVPRGPGMEPIGFVYGPSFPERSVVGLRALADARLIAAAPDLLNALESVVAYFDAPSEGAFSDSQLEACRAAIAAAKGER